MIAGLGLFLALASTGSADLGVMPAGSFPIPADLGAVKSFAQDHENVLALQPDGSVIAFSLSPGYPARTPPAPLTGVKSVGVGDDHSAVLKANGTVVAWGDNYAGQCNANGVANVRQLEVSPYASILVLNDDTVSFYGYAYAPVPTNLRAKKVSAMNGYVAAIRTDGTVVVWGQIYDGIDQVPGGLDHVVDIDAGNSHVLAIKDDGTVVAWGNNDFGQCNVPVGLHDVIAVEAGFYMSYAIKADGSVAAWGSNAYGTLPSINGLMAQIKDSGNFSLYLTNELGVTASDTVGGSTTPLDVLFTLQAPRSVNTTVALTSSNALMPIPTTIQIPAGSTSAKVAIPHNLVTSTQSSDVGALVLSQEVHKTVNIVPFEVNLFTVDGNYQEAGTMNAILKLNASPRSNLAVALASSDATFLQMPSSVTVRSKNNFVSFPITTLDVPSKWTTALTAGWPHSSRAVNLTVLPTPRVKSFKLQGAAMSGNQIMQGTITLTRAAGDSGLSVEVTSDSPAATVPALVTFAPGETTKTFDIQSGDVSVITEIQLAASTTYSSIGKTLTVRPMLVDSLTADTTTLTRGQSTTLTVTLGGTVDVDTDVQLESAFPVALSVPAFVTVPAGASSVSITVTANSLSAPKTTGIRASRAGKHKTVKVTVNP